MRPDTPIWQLLLPIALLGIANALRVGTDRHDRHPQPPAAARGRRRPASTTRPVRSVAVLGSAAIAVLIASRLAANLPGVAGGGAETGVAHLPAALHAGFATAMAQAILLPARGAVSDSSRRPCFALPRHLAGGARDADATAVPPRSAAVAPPARSACGARP